MRNHEVRPIAKPKFDASVQCSNCEYLLRKVNQARLHALLAQAWSEMRDRNVRAEAQVRSAAAEVEEAFRELEQHWREAHRMNC